MNTHLLMITFRVWFIEIAVSGVNYFVLMNRLLISERTFRPAGPKVQSS